MAPTASFQNILFFQYFLPNSPESDNYSEILENEIEISKMNFWWFATTRNSRGVGL
jgi:hypothetical protein